MIRSPGLASLSNELMLLSLGAEAQAAAVVRTWGAVLQAGVRERASGLPGPRVITGQYRDSIRIGEGVRGPGLAGIVVGTDAPQGYRLELGFVGTDSLGRSYNQAPRPHFGPALDEVAEPFFAAMGSIGGDFGPTSSRRR